MMLSDDYGREKARERAVKFATNKEVNAIARSQISFKPVESADATASQAYTAVVNGRQCAALFTWKNGKQAVVLDCERAGLKTGVRYKELWTGKELQDENGVLYWETEGCDAALLQEV